VSPRVYTAQMFPCPKHMPAFPDVTMR